MKKILVLVLMYATVLQSMELSKREAELKIPQSLSTRKYYAIPLNESGKNNFFLTLYQNEPSVKTVKSLLKHLNTKASLEKAKAIYNQASNEKDLSKITNMIENLNKKKNKYGT